MSRPTLIQQVDMFRRDTSIIRKRPPSKDHRKALGIVLLKGPGGALFLISEMRLGGSLGFGD